MVFFSAPLANDTKKARVASLLYYEDDDEDVVFEEDTLSLRQPSKRLCDRDRVGHLLNYDDCPEAGGSFTNEEAKSAFENNSDDENQVKDIFT